MYSTPIRVDGSQTLQALAYGAYDDSAVATAAYDLPVATSMPVATPTFNPLSGSFVDTQSVTITTTTSGATIRYSTDGSAPTSTNGTIYSSPISVSTSQTVRAIGYESGWADSAVATEIYSITQ